jgi:transposase
MTAQCSSFNMDDTPAKILEIIKANKLQHCQEQEPGKKQRRRSCYTTTICATTADNEKLVVYMTKNKHGGENIGALLANRQNKEDDMNKNQGEDKTQTQNSINLMVDASSNNNPVLAEEDKHLANNIVILNCLAHGQRKFTEIEKYYLEECGYFLNQTRAIYHNEHIAKEHNYSLEEKLEYHKKYSTVLIDNIYHKIESLFANKKIEPNSALGRAMKYWLNNKTGLTQFLRIKTAHLDNNWAERSLKAIILQRKNSLFFKTSSSAEVHSGLHSIAKTCDENNINAFKYFNWIQDNSAKAQKSPKDYTPFAYRRYINATELIETKVAMAA